MFRTAALVFRSGFFAESRRLPQICSLAALFCTILFVYGFLWKEAISSGVGMAVSATDLLWYITATEIVVLSPPTIHREVAADLKSGRIIGSMVRPFGYVQLCIFRNLGEIAFRAPFLACVGALTTLILTGGGPQHPTGAILAFLMAPIAAAALSIFYLSIGLSSAWIGNPMPLYFVFSKSLFIFGGLLVPLTLFPEWFQSVSNFLPFRSLMYDLAKGIIGSEGLLGWGYILRLFGWTACALWGAFWLYSKYLERVLREGE